MHIMIKNQLLVFGMQDAFDSGTQAAATPVDSAYDSQAYSPYNAAPGTVISLCQDFK